MPPGTDNEMESGNSTKPDSGNNEAGDKIPVKFTELMAILQVERRKVGAITSERDQLRSACDQLRSDKQSVMQSNEFLKSRIDSLEKKLASAAEKTSLKKIKELEESIDDLQVKLELAKQGEGELRAKLADTAKRADEAEAMAVPMRSSQAALKDYYEKKMADLVSENESLQTELKSMKIAREKTLQEKGSQLITGAAVDVLKEDLKRERNAHHRTKQDLHKIQGNLLAEHSRAEQLDKVNKQLAEKLEEAKAAHQSEGSKLDMLVHVGPGAGSEFGKKKGGFSAFHSLEATVPEHKYKTVVEERDQLAQFQKAHAELAAEWSEAVKQNKLLVANRAGIVLTSMKELKQEFYRLKDDQSDLENSLPLPKGWERALNSSGKVYYINRTQKRTSWRHPSWDNNIVKQRLFGAEPAKSKNQVKAVYRNNDVHIINVQSLPSPFTPTNLLSPVLPSPVSGPKHDISIESTNSADLAELGQLTEQLRLQDSTANLNSPTAKSNSSFSLSSIKTTSSTALQALGNKLSLKNWLANDS